ncbi:phage tail tape measure protein [Rummeliibacillus sp. NPDC094406]|uniref:phage tail tape measure protein n=1 Tax=Rummeliibacillus sp. NPDC094406 TaxID=3364511 RepID=UPI00381B2EE5
MSGKLTRINRQLDSTRIYADKTSSSFSSFGAKIAGIAGFTGLTAGLTASVKTMADFDSAMRKAGAIAGANTDELNKMSEAAKQLGANTSKSASEVATAMTELAAKGFNAQQVMGAMPGIISASEASGENLALTSDTVASALNIWKMKAQESSHVADVLAMAANKTAAGITDMQYAFKYAGAPAKALGMSLEEVSAAVGLVTNAGIDGSTAGTSLRQGLSSLTGPLGTAKKALDKVGFSATDANGNVKSMVDIIKSLKDSTKDMSKADKVTFMKAAVGQESVSTFLSLVDAGPAKLAKLQKALENSDGAAAKAGKNMKAGIGGALEQASGAIETFMINVGDKFAPAVTEVANSISNMNIQPTVDAIEKVGNVAKNVATFTIDNWSGIKETFIGLTASIVTFKTAMAIAPVIMGVTKAITTFRTATTAAAGAQAVFNLALKANPIGLVVTAITGLVGIGVVLYRNWDTVTAATKRFWKAIGGGEDAIRIILGPLGILIGAAVDLAKNWDSTKSVWENVWGAMKRSAAETVNSVIGGINQMIEVINKIPGVNIPVVAKVDWGSTQTAPAKKLPKKNAEIGSLANYAPQNYGGLNLPGHKSGLARVPYDNYVARLHSGERVLTKVENDRYNGTLRRETTGGTTVNNHKNEFSISFSGSTFNVREEADIRKIATVIASEIAQY